MDRDALGQVGGDVAEETKTGGGAVKISKHSSKDWSRAPSPALFTLSCCQHIWVQTCAVYTTWLPRHRASSVTSNHLNSRGGEAYRRSTKPAYMMHCFSAYPEKTVSPPSLWKCWGDLGLSEVTDCDYEKLQCASPLAPLVLKQLTMTLPNYPSCWRFSPMNTGDLQKLPLQETFLPFLVPGPITPCDGWCMHAAKQSTSKKPHCYFKVHWI